MSNKVIKYHLSKPQSEIAACTTRNRVVNAGRRFGKTWCSGAIIMSEATSPYATKRGNFTIWYLAPVADQARSLMWEGWLKYYVPKEYIEYENQQRMIMRLVNGTTINVLSADNPDHLVGNGVDLCIFDEAALMSPKVYELIRPVLADKYHLGKAVFISTPRGYNWFHDLFLKEKSDPKAWKSFQFTTIDGGNVTDEEIEQSKKDMSEKMFAQEYLASFETMANRVYYAYDKKLNNCEYNPTFALGDLHIGIDFNVCPMTATVSHIEFDKKLNREISYTFDEFHENNSDTDYLARWIKTKYPHNNIFVYPDPTGKKRQTSAMGATDFSILEKAGFTVCAPYGWYYNKDKFNTSNTAMCNAVGERRVFVVRDRCPYLTSALEGYTYKDDGTPDKSGGLDHISDAFSYYLNYKFPISGSGIERPTVLGLD